jgi:hypothetical protein
VSLRPEQFQGVNLGDIPPIAVYDTDRQRVLWVLRVAKECLDQAWVSPGDIASVLRDAYGLVIPRQRIPSVLTGGSAAVARRKVMGRYVYQVMQPGLQELDAAPETVTFVDPAQALTHIRRVEALLAERHGTASICDPYVDGRTLDFIAECVNADHVRLLTEKISKPQPFGRDLKAFIQQHAHLPIEVRRAQPGTLHDRYLIDSDSMMIFGTSLNSFGRKQSFVILAGEDVRRVVLAEFDRLWTTATVVS